MIPATSVDASSAVETARLKLAEVCQHPDLPLPELFRRVCEITADSIDVERAGIWLLVNGDKGLRCVSLFQRSTRRHTKGDLIPVVEFPAYLRAVAAWPALMCPNVWTDPRVAELLDSYLAPRGVGAIIAAPVLRDNRLIGVVLLEHASSSRSWSDAERSYARSIGDLVVERMKVAEASLARPGQWPPSAAALATDLRAVFASISAETDILSDILGSTPAASACVARIEEAVARAEALIRDRLGPSATEFGR